MIHVLLALLLIGAPLMARKPVTFEERMSAIERQRHEDMGAIGAMFEEHARQIREHNVARGIVDRGEAMARLDPGRLTGLSGPWRGGAFGHPPDLGQPLLRRLHDDSLTERGGAIVDPSAVGNVLADPLFEIIPLGTTITPATVDTLAGPYWYTKYVHNSGTNPSLRLLSKVWGRNDTVGRSNGGSALGFTILWAAGGSGGNETYYLYPPSPGASDIVYNANATASLPWVVATASIIPAVLDADLVNVTAYIEIIDAVTFAVIDTSDAVELVGLQPGQRVPMSIASTATVAPAGGSGWTWRFRLDVVRTGAGAVTDMDVRIEEPSFARSYSETAPQFQPSIGHWYPPQLMYLPFALANVPAATTDMFLADDAIGVGRMTLKAYWAFAGISCRMNTNKTAGTLTVRGTVNGTYQSGDPSATMSTGTNEATSGALLRPDGVNFITADISQAVGVEAVASGAFTPTTADMICLAAIWVYLV